MIMVFLALGSNIGDRMEYLEEARRRLSEELDANLRCSDIMETRAVGFEGADFLNQVVAFERGDRGVYSILDICQKVEIEMGRKEHTAEYGENGLRIYHDRIIDIDILCFDNVRVSSERLELPHPQCYTREYIGKLVATMDDGDLFYKQLN